MKKRDNSANIKCPYYVTNGDRYVTCEGVYTDIIKQRFSDEYAINAHQRKMCFNYPNKCAIARMLDEKYKEV